MFWVLLIGGGLLTLVVLVLGVGVLLPKSHRASVTKTFGCSADLVWNIITDFAQAPKWRSDIRAVEQLPLRGGNTMWKETSRSGDSITYETVELVPKKRMVRRIADDTLPFGGTWTTELTAAENGGTVVQIVEDGVVYNPVFRFVSKFILGHKRSMENYLRSLSAYLESTSTCNS
jgi:uncharacterized protein YndB with AHSA1/START domain